MLDSGQLGQHQILSEIINYKNYKLYNCEISVNLENRFWDQIFPKKYEWQKFWKNKHWIRNEDIAMYPRTKFNQFGKLQFLRPNLPKTDLGWSFSTNSTWE